MAGTLRAVVAALARVVDRVVDPLRVGDGPNVFRLSPPDTHTTTLEGDTGWARRPPASLCCPRCGSEIRQSNPRDPIDCPRCVAEFESGEFPRLDLLYMECPVCRNRLRHGRRHPNAIRVPEWATCDRCRYHWEYRHTY